MIINHNMSALSALRNLNANSTAQGHASSKLSSGLRITQAADDAAGLAISQSMESQVQGLNQATRNAQDSTSLIQTADGALNETQSILTRMKTLATQAANSTYNDTDRQNMQSEIDQLKTEIDRIANTTSFNNKTLLDGSMSAITSASNGTSIYMRGSLVGANGVSAAGTYKVAVQLQTAGSTQVQESGFMDNINTGKVASGRIQLKNISQFYDSSNKFMLNDTQTIKLVQGDGKTATITISGDDTLNQVASKLANAMYTQLGQSSIMTAGAIGKLVHYNATAGSAALAASGKFVISSAIAGDAGTVHVIADAAIMQAFGFSDYKSATDDVYKVNVFNSAGTKVATNISVQGNNLIGIVNKNVDLQIAGTSAQSANYHASASAFLVSGNSTATTYIHLTDNSQIFQIGSNEKQTMSAVIGNMNSKSLGVNTVQVTDINSASKAITTISAALDRVSAERAGLGAVQNRLGHTVTNLGVEAENLTASESAIKDVDMASEMVNYSKLSILTQTANAMLAKANQTPQLVTQLLQ